MELIEAEAPPQPQVEDAVEMGMVEQLAAPPQHQQQPFVVLGGNVEVEYAGTWFSGVLEYVEGDMANVKCDADPPGVLTVAPLASVRPACSALHERPKMFRHFRSRSVG